MVLTVGMDINPGKKENKRFQKIKYSGLIYFLLGGKKKVFSVTLDLKQQQKIIPSCQRNQTLDSQGNTQCEISLIKNT